MRTDEKTLVDRLRSLANIENPEVIREELDGVLAQDLAEALARIPVEEGVRILQQAEEGLAADVLVDLPTETARAYVNELPDATLALYLDILPMDDAIDLREELGDERFYALLEVIPREDALEIRRLMAYPEDSVGRLMTEEFVRCDPDATMRDVLKDIREKPEEAYEMVNDIYVIDQDRRLLGVFSLRRAVLARPTQTAREMMLQDVVSVPPDMSAEEAARLVTRYGFYAVPVVDPLGRMVGIFTVDDAQEILEEADTEDVLKLGAVSGDPEAYLSLNPFQLVKRRLPWLFALFIAESFTGWVMRHYGQEGGDTLSLNPLTFFIPLLIGAGGNTGSQVTTTITRALALGEVKTADWWRVIQREFLTALMIGFSLGLAGFLRAYLGWSSGLTLSLIVGVTLPAIVLWATLVGSLLPIGAKRLGIDPAVMSAPFITTFVDATGLVIYFEIARQFLKF